jgi:hypothetical protein
LLAFIHVAKTGGQTIETMLANSFGASFSSAPVREQSLNASEHDDGFVVPKFSANDLRHLQHWCPWIKCIGGHPVTLWSDFDEVTPTTWFSMIREPLARGASHFQYNLNDDSVPPREWEQWVRWPVHHNHQVKMFSPDCCAEDAIRRIVEKNVFVGLTERFDESLVILSKLVAPGLNISYRRTNTASDNTRAREVLADPQMTEQLKAMYREELPLYEFISQQWYPKFQKEYGPTLVADVEQFRKNRESGFNQWNYWMSRLNHHLVLKASLKFR